ncbi:MAG: tRNA (adenosine(37)-N6)-threonylcarbamoyltransferase complex transferase subunit TsaD [Thermosulfidibacteraceae bacterium]
MIVVGIETSCDDTGVAVLKDKKEILSNLLSSQAKIHSIFGGVVPEIAARKHLDNILPIFDSALKEAGITLENIDCIGVTYRPGLIPSLIIGVTFAKAIHIATGIPIVGVDHIEAHLFAIMLERDVEFPFVGLVVSGGHTSLLVARDFLDVEEVGITLDDAAGEAFDKVAKILNLGYPGGPIIDKMAKRGNKEAIKFPIPKVSDYNFSFSGIKTSVVNLVKKLDVIDENLICNISASFQESVVDFLIGKTLSLAIERGISRIVAAGGVACNSRLREKFHEECKKHNISVYFPSPKLCIDNGLMVAYLASILYERGIVSSIDLDAISRRSSKRERYLRV